MGREDGYTLIEIAIAAAIGVILISLLAVIGSRMVAAASSLDTRLQTQSAAQHLLERLTSEAATSWAVYEPHNDVNGASNGDGHEVDFFSEDGAHRTFIWAYNYNAQTKHLARLIAAPSGPQTDEDFGTFDSFAATGIDASQLGAQDPLFAGAVVPSVAIGYDAAPGATGGNGLVRIDLQSLGAHTSELIASSNAPTTFTVVVKYTPSPPPPPTPTPTPLAMSSPTPTPN